jgi:hypothetical protein
MNRSPTILACSSERPSINILMYRSKSSVDASFPVERPSLHINKFYAATIVGGLLIAFFARRALRRGAETGAARDRQRWRGGGVCRVGSGSCLERSYTKDVGLEGMAPSCKPSGEEPLVTLMNCKSAFSGPSGRQGGCGVCNGSQADSRGARESSEASEKQTDSNTGASMLG